MLAATRGLYKTYLSGMQKDGWPPVDMPGWRQRQIAGTVPVTGSSIAFRSDESLGTEVRSPDGVALGSADDLVLNQETGKLGYLAISRGGFFDPNHTPNGENGMAKAATRAVSVEIVRTGLGGPATDARASGR